MVKSGNDTPLKLLLKPAPELTQEPEPHKLPRDLHEGDCCPSCGVEELEYDGLLNLGCPKCGYALGGCFT